MNDAQALHVARVRLGALLAQARAGGQVTAYQMARALEPMLEVALAIAREEGRWQAARSIDVAAAAAAEAEARARFGPGAWEPGEPGCADPRVPSALPPRRPSSARAPRGAGPGRPRPGRHVGRPSGRSHPIEAVEKSAACA